MQDKHMNILYWIAMVVLLGYFAYIRGWILTDFESITPQQAQALLQDDNVTLLDVRTALEFDREHIKDAKLLPLNLLKENLTELEDIKKKKILVYCHSGSRSIKASRILKANGFIPINLKGGILQWKSDGFSVVK